MFLTDISILVTILSAVRATEPESGDIVRPSFYLDDFTQEKAVSNSATATSTAGSEIRNTVSDVSLATCNPVSTTGCSADAALATSVADDFKEASNNYLPYKAASQIFYGDDGLELTIAKRYDNPSLMSDFYIMFGRLEVSLKSASGKGIISSFFLQSDDLDEIDFEWFGGDISQMQSNYFSKGNTTVYDRGQYHSMADPRADYHNYTLDWTESALTWYIDGTAVRTLTNDSSGGYPQSPMRVFFGIWAGGDPDNSEGTIEWAGGLTDYSDAPFSMYINNLIVSDYSTGDEYSYSDQTGDWTSIVAKNGEVLGRKSEAIKEFAQLVGGSTIDASAKSTVSVSALSVSTSSSGSSKIAASSTSTKTSVLNSTTNKASSLTLNTSTTASSAHSINERTISTVTSSKSESSSTKSISTMSSNGGNIVKISSLLGLGFFAFNLL
ncbi:transglycosylase [Martiniozyma asiatica (nom. inval.)]|nr:transglycosylase [Martiniozyma asiatica]